MQSWNILFQKKKVRNSNPPTVLSNTKAISTAIPDIHDWVSMPGPPELLSTPVIYFQIGTEK